MALQSPVPLDAPMQAGEESMTPTPASVSAPTGAVAPVLGKETLEMISGVVRTLSEAKKDDQLISTMFQRLPSRRLLADYYNAIKQPVAFSTIRQKVVRKQYKDIREFVRDLAMIPHNAQVYNKPSALVYSDAIVLRELMKEQLQGLVDEGKITAEEAEFPDLGEIPEAEDSPPPVSDEEQEAEVEDDEEEDEEDEDESDEEAPKRRGRKPGRRSSAVTKREDVKEDGNKNKTRGRPPKVETAMEKRISALIKGLRKFKSPSGGLKINAFEKLPDKMQLPSYYIEIKNPMAMDLVKKKAKRKKYQSVDQVLRDLELIFENAKSFNEDSSEIFRDAVDLQRQARLIAEQEKQKPDSDYADEDGRLPLPQIVYKDEVYKIGDWIHLKNDNDMMKPIPAQIYRTWRDSEGRDWINACWYFRPEQTVHRFEKQFFENEVVKTGRYLDHVIDDVIDRCFVMFFTRYSKGRPRGFPPDKQVYVCEARYNEEYRKLNKIKTWASCVPDEVRDKDYEMDFFNSPKKMKKVPSPIKYLLKDNAKETDDLPEPTWGTAFGPPVIGAVHRRPRDANESPPPEPTPSSPLQTLPASTPVRQVPSMSSQRPEYDSQGEINMTGGSTNTLPSPTVNTNTMQNTYNQQLEAARPSPYPAPTTQHSSFGSSSHLAASPAPHYQSHGQYNQYGNHHGNQYGTDSTPNHQQPSNHQAFNSYVPSSVPRPVPATPMPQVSQSNSYHQPRQHEVYRLDDMANSQIPSDIIDQFHHDEAGKVLFFNTPPIDMKPVPEPKQNLAHSLRYLADKARDKEPDNKRKRPVYSLEMEAKATQLAKRMKTELAAKKKEIEARNILRMLDWCEEIDKGTDELYMQMEGKDWKIARAADLARLAEKQAETAAKELQFKKNREARAKRDEIHIGRNTL